MRFIHFTDPHLSSLAGQSFFALSAKRRSGYLSWTRRRQGIHRRDVLQRLVSAVRNEAPDQIVLTGDMIQIGLEEEIREVDAWLRELAPAEQIFFVPGNHDVYATDSWRAIRRHWGYLLPDPVAGESDSPAAGYPLVRDFGRIRWIGASSACVTPIFSARGALGSRQIERLDRLLEESRENGRLSCLAIHHPPLKGMAQWRKALKEIEVTENLLARHQPALTCCGHLHHNVHLRKTAAQVFCTASASSAINASYRVFDIEGGGSSAAGGWSIRMQLKTLELQEAGFRLVDDQRWSVPA